VTDLRNYASVTAAYWAFTLTDGALRMLVLLHFHRMGFSPLDLAFLFLLYEAAGIVTNFLGGWLGARHGLRLTLVAGLALQVFALLLLSAVSPGWTIALSVAYVMAAQALSGVAKDLVKMSSKSTVRVAVGDGNQGLLFRWVALLTGSKNALKGVGFLLGGILLQWLGYREGLWAMAAALAVATVITLFLVRGDLGRATQKIVRRELFSKSREINYLSAARIFLFASRDVWFVVALPVFLYSSFGWTFDQVGAFMAAWIVGYGIVQASVPAFLRKTRTAGTAAAAARNWGLVLSLLPAAIAVAVLPTEPDFAGLWPQLASFAPLALMGGLLLFGVVFAVNSALHSYLIVAYSDADKVALNVGFYYAANAAGRLIGTLLSGLMYQYFGIAACLATSAVLVLVAVVFVVPLAPGQTGTATPASP